MMLLQIISTTVWVWFERNSFGLTVPSFMKILSTVYREWVA